MDKLLITGQKQLNGKVTISKSKNAYLPILTGVLLNPEPVHFLNIPKLKDMDTTCKLLSKLGVKIAVEGNRTSLCAGDITSCEATYDLVKTMRASILVLGPLLTRFHRAKVSLPGGCAIGARPIDIHLSNLEKLGAKIVLHAGYVEAFTEGLIGTKLVLSFPSVGATENLMMAAVLAKGETVIENAAMEPEIDDLANFLNSMGAKVSGIGSNILHIEGVKSLHETTYEAIGDRIEAATYLIAGLITGGKVTVLGVNPDHLDSVLAVLKDMGTNVEVTNDSITVSAKNLKSAKVETSPFPGFPTDIQAQLVALVTQASGTSIITENIFENRFMHVSELLRLGAKIELKGNSAIIEGVSALQGAPVMCTDLRASAALIIAALAAKGESEIHRIYHLDRGYENLEAKLSALGAQVQRVRE